MDHLQVKFLFLIETILYNAKIIAVRCQSLQKNV